MIQAVKNFLKRILPPPVHAFNREIERVLTAIQTQNELTSSHLQRLEESEKLIAQHLQVLEQALREMEQQHREHLERDTTLLQESLAVTAQTMEQQGEQLKHGTTLLQESLTASLHALEQRQSERTTSLQESLTDALLTLEQRQSERTTSLQESLTDALLTLEQRQSECTTSLQESLTDALLTLEQRQSECTTSLQESLTDALLTLEQRQSECTTSLQESLTITKQTLEQQAEEANKNLLTVVDRTKTLLTRVPKPAKYTYNYCKSLPSSKYEEALSQWYKEQVGTTLNLEFPETYNEKLQWLKLYDSTPLKTLLSDKYLVRDWVKEKIGEEYLIPLLGVWATFDEIDFDRLPDRFVLKVNHGSGWNLIVTDKSQMDTAAAKEKFDTWMKTNFAFYYGFQLQYMNISPKIIAEAYLENQNNDLYDYKVFCFNGKAESIMFLSERKQELKMAFYDLDWNKLSFVYDHSMNKEEIPKPKNLNSMIRLAETLAQDFAHVRVDFYVLNDGTIKFGEMTFTSASGTCKWDPPEQDEIYGKLLHLPEKSPLPKRER